MPSQCTTAPQQSPLVIPTCTFPASRLTCFALHDCKPSGNELEVPTCKAASRVAGGAVAERGALRFVSFYHAAPHERVPAAALHHAVRGRVAAPALDLHASGAEVQHGRCLKHVGSSDLHLYMQCMHS